MTEDDTYNALRRIPRSQLEDRYELICDGLMHTEANRFHECLIYEAEVKRYHRYKKLSFIFGEPELITINTAQPRILLETMYGSDFKGTGWTVEDYCELVYKEAVDRFQNAQKLKKKKAWLFAGCCLVSGLMSAVISPFLGHAAFKVAVAVPVLLGFGAGQVFINVSRNMDKKR